MTELDTASERAHIEDASGLQRYAAARRYLDAYDQLRAENQRLERLIVRDAEGRIVTQGAFNAANASVVRLYEENQQLREAVNEVRDLIKESYGVAGLHQNGDVAEWSELLPGGNFEGWLLNLGELAGLPEGDINADAE